jgi:hypothetical protein
VGHLRKHGFAVRSTYQEDLSAVRAQHGVPSDLESCHTAVIAGYVVEGHVPGDLILQVLKDRPRIAGLAVPGMPASSPGMEGAGGRPGPYQVFAFDQKGGRTVFATRG